MLGLLTLWEKVLWQSVKAYKQYFTGKIFLQVHYFYRHIYIYGTLHRHNVYIGHHYTVMHACVYIATAEEL